MATASGAVPPVVVPPVALTIAGSDSGGGAGIAADLRTFAVHKVFGTLAVTAVTAQDTTAVHGIVTLPAAFVDAQIDAAMGDFPVAAAKTGMLANLQILELITARAAAGRLPPLVVDPVMVASSGARLLEEGAVAGYRRLLRHATVVTPNLAEAAILTGRSVNDVEEMADAARTLVGYGCRVALITGGHLHGSEAVDVLYDGTEVQFLAEEMVATRNIHGTGCTLSAAIAANLALGRNPIDAVVRAKRYVTAVIRASSRWALGEGPGPLDHLSATAD
jgi:hydroxymethylpyrimidine/phosphomethylpyrimidine kinase